MKEITLEDYQLAQLWEHWDAAGVLDDLPEEEWKELESRCDATRAYLAEHGIPDHLKGVVITP